MLELGEADESRSNILTGIPLAGLCGWTRLSTTVPARLKDGWEEFFMLQVSILQTASYGYKSSSHCWVCREWHPVFTQIPYSKGIQFLSMLSSLSFCLPRWQKQQIGSIAQHIT